MYICELIITYIEKMVEKCYWVDNTPNNIKIKKNGKKNRMYTKYKYK